MAENEEENSLISYDIERTIQQVLNTEEDEDDAYSCKSNLFFNEANTRYSELKFGDHASDYAGRRTQITNIDTKSMISNQDKYISFVQDEISLDGTEKTGNLFIPFMERENRFPSNTHENSFPESTSSLCVTDKYTDDIPYEINYGKAGDIKIDQGYQTIILNNHERIDKVVDQLFKHNDSSKNTIKIECYVGQLTLEDIQSIFRQFLNISQIHLIDRLNDKLLGTHFRSNKMNPQKNMYFNQMTDSGILASEITPSLEKMTMADATPKKIFIRHQK